MIRSESQGAVGRLTLARPQLRNALNGEVMTAIAQALDAFESDAATSLIVVTGEGAAFSAGADLSAMRKAGEQDARSNRADARQMGELFHRVAAFPKPVVARVNGPAMGGGVGLMAACDIVVAVEDAFFAFSEVRLGLVPAMISPFCIRRLGPAVARRLFLTGERLSADDAQSYGLVDVVATTETLDEAVAAVAAKLMRGGPQALAEAKKLVDTVVALDPSAVLDYTADCIARLRASDEAQEGMSAFLQKRPARWVPKDGS